MTNSSPFAVTFHKWFTVTCSDSTMLLALKRHKIKSKYEMPQLSISVPGRKCPVKRAFHSLSLNTAQICIIGLLQQLHPPFYVQFSYWVTIWRSLKVGIMLSVWCLILVGNDWPPVNTTISQCITLKSHLNTFN